MKKVLFEQKKIIKLFNKWCLVENKREMQHALQTKQISFLPTYIKLILGVFQQTHTA
jgi:hypothetical protein